MFQGEPRPTSQWAGHWDCWLATSIRSPCQPIETANCNGSGVHHSLLICARMTRRIKLLSKPDEKSQCKRLGNGIPWLPSASNAMAEPRHTVPCAFCKRNLFWLAFEMALANQLAGAWVTKAKQAPMRAPVIDHLKLCVMAWLRWHSRSRLYWHCLLGVEASAKLFAHPIQLLH